MTDARKPNSKDRERGRELAQLRKDRRLTQAAVAERIGVSTQQYGKYERGENRLSVDRYDAILKCLDDLKPGLATGLGEKSQANFDAPISKSALQKRVDEMQAALKLFQRHLDQL